ncbi:MAG: hypothetical protein RLZZ387_4629 [Chloroflexota bacterium]|jgi:hypothetical protein
MRRHALLLLLLLAALAPGLAARPARAAAHLIYDDVLTSGWQNYSWANVNLAASAPARGQSSIAVTYGAVPPYQGLFLAHPDIATTGYTRLRFWMHGGAAGGQLVQVYVKMADGTDGPKVPVPAPPAGAWAEVQVPLAALGAAGGAITGVTWQDRSGGAQPTFYVDDIALVEDVSPDDPILSDGLVHPRAAPADGLTGVVVQARAADAQGLGDVQSVTVDAAAIGRGTLALRDDGRSADGAAGDGLFGAVMSVSPGTRPGEHMLVAVAQDRAGHRDSLQLGALAVLDPYLPSAPPGLPQRIGYGSNDWSANPSSDWQKGSGVPWDYVYQYITYEWFVDGWGGDYVGRFVRYAWDRGYVPVVSVYLMLGVPPATGEGAAEYAAKLQQPETVRAYLAALTEAARQARGVRPVIFHLEPDFYGYMQSYTRSPGRPAGIVPDDPESIAVAMPTALNALGYADTLGGLGRRMVDLVHEQAPNALVAPHASAWATGIEPNAAAPTEVAGLAEDTAAFIDAMGGAEADMLFVEWSDRDAGSGLRPWWDDTNRLLPRPTRAVLWQSALAGASGKRLVLWQVPVGHMGLDDTCGRYRDNRAAYTFRHPRDLYASGVVAVLFGAGAPCMTSPSTDGGHLAAQGAVAYAPPAAVGGLALLGSGDYTASLRWDAGAEPDLWGYRLRFEPAAGGGNAFTQDVGPATGATVSIPRAGSWRISVAAYDAMGNVGPSSAPVLVTTTSDAPATLYVPLVLR